MSELHYPDLHIQGFRGFKDLEIPKLGRVNLITGKNNTGKSSVLEALWLHADKGSPRLAYEIIKSREEYWYGPNSGPDPFPLAGLFYGFPKSVTVCDPIIIRTASKTISSQLVLTPGLFRADLDPYIGRSLVRIEGAEVEGIDLEPGITVKTDEREWNWGVTVLHRFANPEPGVMRVPTVPMIECQVVKPYTSDQTDSLGPLWDRVSLTEHENAVIEALRLFEPGIAAISMVASDSHQRSRIAMVRTENVPRPIPLRSFGDGMNRLFALILSLVNARGGILLIDEFENGLHYTIQSDTWRMIFKLARDLDVQVFATTHSLDAIKAFQKASVESPEDGMYLRLTRWKGEIIQLLWDEGELGNAVELCMEMR